MRTKTYICRLLCGSVIALTTCSWTSADSSYLSSKFAKDRPAFPVPQMLEDWPCETVETQQVTGCFRLEPEKVTFPCSKASSEKVCELVPACKPVVARNLRTAQSEEAPRPVRNLLKGSQGYSRRFFGSTDPEMNSVSRGELCDEEAFVEQEEECVRYIEKDVCTEYPEVVEETCYKNVTGERYDCPVIMRSVTCNFIHVYPEGQEVKKPPTTMAPPSADGPSVAAGGGGPAPPVAPPTADAQAGTPTPPALDVPGPQVSPSDDIEQKAAKLFNTPRYSSRRLHIRKITPFSVAGGPYPRKPRLEAWPRPPPGICHGPDCPPHTIPQCRELPVVTHSTCERVPYQKPYPCKKTVQRKECHKETVKKTYSCSSVRVVKKRIPCQYSNHKRNLVRLQQSLTPRSDLVPESRIAGEPTANGFIDPLSQPPAGVAHEVTQIYGET